MEKNEVIREKNRENLYSFYFNLGVKSGFKTGSISSARYISGLSMAWPSYILGGGKMAKSTLFDIFRQMKEGTLPFFWIRTLDEDPEFENFAGENGIRKINLWSGMYLNKNTSFRLPVPLSGLVFEEVVTQNDLKDWLRVVNLEIMSHRELSLKTFLNVLNDPGFKFFRVTKGKKTFSTILMHKRITDTGIYMVSTVLNERGKGIGRWITACAIDYFIEKGYNEFVLHATPLGYSVYRKLDFEQCCDFGIFWMLGKK
jgi:hypothetical protein